MRWIGMDVHRDFCEVAIGERAESARQDGCGREWCAGGLAASLLRNDVVALEATSGSDRIVSSWSAAGSG